MTVNPFWFGVLITIVAEIVLFIIITIIGSHAHKDDEEKLPEGAVGEEKFKEILKEAVAEVAKENKFIIGEAVEEKK